MQLEVVLPAKELLADLALELAASAVGGDVAAQVPLTGEHLSAHRNQAESAALGDIAELKGQRTCRLYKKHELSDRFLGKEALRGPSVFVEGKYTQS